MAGYIMTLNGDGLENLEKCFRNGVYSTSLILPNNGKWATHHEGTFADYLSMKEGDNIYFFIKRMIYGIGQIVNVGDDCKYLNYKDADTPRACDDKTYEEMNPVLDASYSKENICFCTFKPSPLFFSRGVEMDDVLNSNPNKFKMLRALWKLSFIKIDDEENQALFDIILKRNETNLILNTNTYSYDTEYCAKLRKRINASNKFSADRILSSCAEDKQIKHEMAIEAAMCEMLSSRHHDIFGKKWDYISHQVVASPFKPIDYMDKMDIFGYRYIEGYKTISKYIIVEIKKDTAKPGVIDQIMKYVDWVNVEYAHGDYSMIEAFVVANKIPDDVVKEKEKDAVRGYVKGYHPAETNIWKNLRLVEYEYSNGKLCFSEIG